MTCDDVTVEVAAALPCDKNRDEITVAGPSAPRRESLGGHSPGGGLPSAHHRLPASAGSGQDGAVADPPTCGDAPVAADLERKVGAMKAAGGRRSQSTAARSGSRKRASKTPSKSASTTSKTARSKVNKSTLKGTIDTLPSGSLRVRVPAGTDSYTGRPLTLTDTIPVDTPNQRDVAEEILREFNRQIEEKRHPQSDASLTTLLEHHLGDWWKGTDQRAKSLLSYVRNHIAPVIGDRHRARDVDADLLEWFYEDCARCRTHCRTHNQIDHYTDGDHTCSDRCVKHECQGLAATTIRHMHFLISGAYRAGMKTSRRWVVHNPADTATPPSAPAYTPQPPTLEQMARILNQAFLDDPDWGVLLWYETTSGCRRGEVCGLKDGDLLDRDDDADRVTAAIERAIKKAPTSWYVGAPKGGKPRRVVLDPVTTMLMREHREWRRERATRKGMELAEDAYTFSTGTDGRRYRTPHSITQRFTRLAAKLGIKTTVHKLRHYSATELILAGVDIRTVAGRLGHGGGGATTLKVYAAFVEEADQRAADAISARMPERPQILSAAERALAAPRAPYEKMAVKLREQLLAGRYADGSEIPTLKKLAAAFGVAKGTAHRAVDLLRTWGLVDGGGRGHANVWVVPSENLDTALTTRSPEMSPEQATAGTVPGDDKPSAEGAVATCGEPVDIEVIHLGRSAHRFSTVADPDDTFQMLGLLVDAVRRADGDPSEIGDYEMVVRYAGERGIIRTFVAPPHATAPQAPGEHQERATLAAVS